MAGDRRRTQIGWRVGGALCGLLLAACSRQEPPAPDAPTVVQAVTPDSPAPPVATVETLSRQTAGPGPGADLELVAREAAAFANMIAALRKFAGDEIELNANPLDLESFVRGKSERDLLKFAEAAQYKSPFAAMQVLEYLLRHSVDAKIRMVAAWRYADLAGTYGDARDRQRGADCFDLLADLRADDQFVASLTPFDRDELLTALQRLIVTLDLDETKAYQRMADLFRQHPSAEVDLSYADWFDAMALYRTGRESDRTEMLARFQAIRNRGVYGRFFAEKDVIDRWLAKTPDEIQEEYNRFRELRTSSEPRIAERRSRLDRLPPAERLEEMHRLSEEARVRREARDHPAETTP
jgi:hypothetical protein